MKMAENSVATLIFQNDCDAINSKCVEDVEDGVDGGKGSQGTPEMATVDENPEPDKVEDRSSAVTQEDAVEKLLAGEHENNDEFAEEIMLEAENIDGGDGDGIEFKTGNVLLDCAEIDKAQLFQEDENAVIVEGDLEDPQKVTSDNCEEEETDQDNNKCLNKMQIMEDVREGCSVQPSSPGHAEERVEEVNKDAKKNGFGEHVLLEEEQVADKEVYDKETQQLVSGVDVKPETPEQADLDDSNNHVNDDSNTSTSCEGNLKRKSEDLDSANKRFRGDIQQSFYARDKILNEFIEMADCSTVEQLQIQSEQILAEIRTLNELAREKEREWNNIIHLKKMKEELLLRMQRRKQVMLWSSDKTSENGDDDEGVANNKSPSQSILKANLMNPNKDSRLFNNSDRNKSKSRQQQQQQQELNGNVDYRQNKQRPILDVQSIIADYRQRHPETVPRRGRRIRNPPLDRKSSLLPNQSDINSELGNLIHAMENNRDGFRPSSTESVTPEPSFKDMLVQFAKLSQSERHELIQNAIKPPPPYPEVTVHPVPTTTTTAPTNSLLHGILTKTPTKSNTNTSFSPTLARLLTAPERSQAAVAGNMVLNPGNMSISEILSASKARNEITITPVGSQFEPAAKIKTQDEEEAEDSADRLVIDESTEVVDGRGRGDNSSDGGDEVPQCQGCNQKSALFVCAGCGNQWYCSRECQVSAWDEHSEVCSG